MDVEGDAIGQHTPRWARQAGRPQGAPRSLEGLGELEWIAVDTQCQGQRWDELLAAEHFLGAGPLAGRRLRYLIHSARYGDVAALAFSAAAWQLAARDAYIGWDAETREANLQQVVCNTRFLIRADVSVPGLASHVLARTLRRLPRDWTTRYGEAPALVETFVDRARHRGGCYRAANWQYVGDTRGRGRNDRGHHRRRSIKAVYVYPLRRDWRRRLGGSAAPKAALDHDDWARHEFAHALGCDRRLRERLITVSRDFAAHSEAPPPQACGGRARTKAAYRLLANPRVTMRDLLASHAQATSGRCRQQAVVLAVQDTTSLNYSHATLTEGLGPISTRAHGAQGLLVHDTMAFSVQGAPLGLVDVQAWARDHANAGLRRLGDDDERGLDDKESSKWLHSHAAASRLQRQLPDTRVVSVADREGDVYELLQAAQQPDHADVVARARQKRRLADGQGRLVEALDAHPPGTTLTLAIPPRGKQAGRTAQLAVRWQRVTLEPPKAKRHLARVTLDVVRATESEPPAGVQPLEWTLLSTVATETAEDACERLQWYATRWLIEVYHRTLKSGCRIEDRHLGDAERLESALAIDLVVAWRVFWLAKWTREHPQAPASAYLEPDEWKALLVRTGENRDPSDDDEPSLYHAMHLIARLGGYQDRKREPGTQTLWRGLQRIDDITDVYRKMAALLHRIDKPP